MPVGHPKDPAAHAAVLAANAAKRAEAKKSEEALEALRSKLTGQPVRTIAEARKDDAAKRTAKRDDDVIIARKLATQGHTNASIAINMGITESSVRSLLGRARKTGQARKEAFTAFDATTIRDLEEELKHKDKLIDDLEVHVAELQTGIARLRDDLIRVRVDRAKAEARVETVLDLAAKLV